EALTDEIARAAWARLQTIEDGGGLVAALTNGDVAREVEAANAARGELKIVGVTAFPPTEEAPVEVEKAAAQPVQAPDARLPGPDGR
ncbi:methylmalonyl-CoA mutase family protein, partial [Shewanella sp. C31]|nr:methylmalonyl-CoA mutase family protein [Shewanella electrica]